MQFLGRPHEGEQLSTDTNEMKFRIKGAESLYEKLRSFNPLQVLTCGPYDGPHPFPLRQGAGPSESAHKADFLFLSQFEGRVFVQGSLEYTAMQVARHLRSQIAIRTHEHVPYCASFSVSLPWLTAEPRLSSNC